MTSNLLSSPPTKCSPALAFPRPSESETTHSCRPCWNHLSHRLSFSLPTFPDQSILASICMSVCIDANYWCIIVCLYFYPLLMNKRERTDWWMNTISKKFGTVFQSLSWNSQKLLYGEYNRASGGVLHAHFGKQRICVFPSFMMIMLSLIRF